MSERSHDKGSRLVTREDKHAAFEWLRALALDESLSDDVQWFAAVAFQEWGKLAAPSARNTIIEECAKVCEEKANKPKEQTTEYAQFMLRAAAEEIRDLMRPTDGGSHE